ncbi:hypothetical protein BKP35_18010 [Anaerobacillus arseniciselenatis]|uniref:DNA-binding response regulator n=1 Tax=Anaerobacillus arseniciselenatis TaxID=85682 RepID=A0A1S2L7C5_9BACI|nr:response regulator transcription factor [Anaerobacillus arseniciselenatis]OIJ08224.1 hypothetical protein BKP35_18010 [Anaerobacillus arseniciselenatis]
MKVKILLVDDHDALLSGIKLWLSQVEEWEVVAEASSGEEAIELTRSLKPDLVLMDISMPGIGGIGALEKIKEENPNVKVLMLTMHSEEEYLKRALIKGASGFVLKKAAHTELISAINTVLSGETYIYPSLTNLLIKGFVGKDEEGKEQNSKRSLLSEREEEVLKYIALGFTYGEIAKQLFVSIKTVEAYKSRISEKLKMKRRSELVRFAIDEGLISINE